MSGILLWWVIIIEIEKDGKNVVKFPHCEQCYLFTFQDKNQNS